MNTIVSKSYNPVVPLLARVGIGILFVLFGGRGILAFAGSVGYFTKLGFPAPEAMVVLAIAVQIVGGLLLILGWKTRWAAWLLVAYVIIATLMAHRYWEYDASQYVAQMTNFYKNLAILGGLLMIAAFGPGRHSFDKG
jgi:putative oxidoreductase